MAAADGLGSHPFGYDPHDLGLGFALPPDQRTSTDAVADTQMDTARFAGPIDNTTVAVARIACGQVASATRDG